MPPAPVPSSLTARKVAIDTYRENVAYLRRDCPVYRAEGFQALSKVEVGSNNGAILAVLNVVDDPRLVGERELGLSEEAFTLLGITEGATVHIAHAEPPASIASLKRKIAGERLGRDEIAAMVRDIAAHRYSKIELAAFLVATSKTEVDIIDAQGRRAFEWRRPRLAPLVHEVVAERDGLVVGIDNERMARIARLAGAPNVESAGVDLFCRLGDTVSRGQPLYRVHSASPSELDFARRFASHGSGYTLGREGDVLPEVSVEF